MTQKELGEKLGVSQAAIGQFEKSNTLRFDTIKKLAIALDVPEMELLKINSQAELVAKNIQYYLLVNGMTRQELANALGISLTTVTKFCTGQAAPRLETLQQIAVCLNIKLTDLLGNNFEIKQGSGHIYDAETQSYKPYTGEYIDLTDRAKLIDTYDNLNDLGKKEALKRVEELTEIKKYIEE